MRAVRPSALALAALACGTVALAAVPHPTPRSGAPVRIGARIVFTVHAGDGDTLPSARAQRAIDAIGAALNDPACSPESIAVEYDLDLPVIVACDRRVLAVGPLDVEREGESPDDVAFGWATALRAAFATEKQVAYSSHLLRRAILGLVLPLAFLGVGALLHLGSRRVRQRLHAPPTDAGLRIGRLRVLASRAERVGTAQAVRVVTWIGYVALVYVFAAVLFRQFPATARWAARMVGPLAVASSELGQWVPVLGLVVLSGIVLRVVLALLGRLFEQVRAGQVRIEPFLSPERAGPTEFVARTAAVVATLLFVGWIVPGELGLVLEGAVAIAALGLAAGAWDTCANLVAGFVSLYGRPLRRGQHVRIGAVAGVLCEKSLLHLRVESATGCTVLIPNRRLLGETIEILAPAEWLPLRLLLRAPGGPAAALALVHQASASVGKRREDARAALRAVRDGTLVVDARWPCAGEDPDALRHRLIEACLACADGLEVEVVSIEPCPSFEP